MGARAFVGLRVPAEVAGPLGAAVTALRERAPDLRWVAPVDWHLTLAFLGEVEEPRRGVAGAAVGAACAGLGPVAITLDGALGHFGGRVLWASVASSPGLQVLAELVQRQLRESGFTLPARPFAAHLTLARARAGRRTVTRLARHRVPGVSWRATEVALLSSRPSSAVPPRYATEATWPLDG